MGLRAGIKLKRSAGSAKQTLDEEYEADDLLTELGERRAMKKQFQEHGSSAVLAAKWELWFARQALMQAKPHSS
jgi:hypothetical protein